MKTEKTWIVALDNTKMDQGVLKYTQFLSKLVKPDKLNFLHVIKEKKTPSYIPDEYAHLHDLVVEDLRLVMENKVDERFKDSKIPYRTLVKTGSPFEEIIDLALHENATLVIAGRKKQTSGSGVIGDNLSRSLPGDFILVPEDFEPKLDTILVSTDFSEHSTIAMQRVLDLTTNNKDVRIVAQNSYTVPTGYSKSGKTYEEFADIIKGITEKEMLRWIGQFNRKIDHALTLQEDESLSDQNLEQARNVKADMIVIGSKGHTATSRVLLGSHTIKLVKLNQEFPLLIIKKEGENLRLLDAIKSL